MSENQQRFTFQKSERLSRKKHISQLFDTGDSFFLHPFKVIYLPREHVVSDEGPLEGGNKILISVSRSHHKKAVDRNRIKRLVREAYRTQKHILLDGSRQKYFIAYIYVGKEIPQYQDVATRLKETLLRLRDISNEVDSKKKK